MTPINLSELDYEKIRISLVNYLKKQDTVKDLNFEGSAVNFLLDLLAYNTMYYAHFANMIASESFLDSAQLERSIVSLVKPLGYVVPTKTSASTTIQLKNLFTPGPIEPFKLSVIGTTPEGVQYTFWNADFVEVDSQNMTEKFSAYEGKYVSLSYGGDGFDFPDQKIFIPDLNLDIRTLQVSVKQISVPINLRKYNIWERYDLYSGMFVKNDTQIYTVERTTTGFIISFAGSVGQKLVSGDQVKIEYLSSSGSFANNCSAFKVLQTPSSGSSVNYSMISSGGLDSANLDEVRTNAPSVFSAQQRLVTSGDYLSYLKELGLDTAKVWGGETNTPPIYGRVFYSYLDKSGISDAKIASRLKNRSLITVIPEFVYANTTRVIFDLVLKYDSNVVTYTQSDFDTIKNNILQLYPNNEFDLVFSKDEVKSAVEEKTGYYLSTATDDWNIVLEQVFAPQTSTVTLNFKTELMGGSGQANGSGAYSLPVTSSKFPGTKLIIRDNPITFNSTNAPRVGLLSIDSVNESGAITSDTPLLDIGKIDYSTGVLTITENIFNENVYMRVKPKNQIQYAGKDQILLQVETNREEVSAL